MNDTTNIKDSTEQNETPKGTLSVANLDLRDWFAGKAMQGLMDAAMPMPEIAQAAYQMADAMLEERNK